MDANRGLVLIGHQPVRCHCLRARSHSLSLNWGLLAFNLLDWVGIDHSSRIAVNRDSPCLHWISAWIRWSNEIHVDSVLHLHQPCHWERPSEWVHAHQQKLGPSWAAGRFCQLGCSLQLSGRSGGHPHPIAPTGHLLASYALNGQLHLPRNSHLPNQSRQFQWLHRKLHLSALLINTRMAIYSPQNYEIALPHLWASHSLSRNVRQLELRRPSHWRWLPAIPLPIGVLSKLPRLIQIFNHSFGFYCSNRLSRLQAPNRCQVFYPSRQIPTQICSFQFTLLPNSSPKYPCCWGAMPDWFWGKYQSNWLGNQFANHSKFLQLHSWERIHYPSRNFQWRRVLSLRALPQCINFVIHRFCRSNIKFCLLLSFLMMLSPTL